MKVVMSAIEAAKSIKYIRIEIVIENSSIDQLALYQKCDFGVTGIDTDYFIGHCREKIFENGIQRRDMIRLSNVLVQS